MKNLSYGLVSLLVLFCIPTSTFTAGADNGPSADGGFQFTVGDGVTKSIQFHAKVNKDGITKGAMTFTDPGQIPTPGESSANNSSSGVSVSADFDCLVINGNKAVMSGLITDANVGGLVGHRVLLVVEDNGEGVNQPNLDKLTWGIYQPLNRTWIPQDAEDPTDTGWFNEWFATDFERPDDIPIPGSPSEVIGCQTFPLASYAFVDVEHGSGNIQVKP